MSGLWVPEERNSAGEPILDLWEPKSGHLRSRPLHFTMGRSGGRWKKLFFDVVRPRVGAYYLVDVEYEWIVGS